MALPSLWIEDTPFPTYPKLRGNLDTDVLVVGAGIAGMTASLLLRQAGKRVALIEARQVGHGSVRRSWCGRHRCQRRCRRNTRCR